MSKPAERAPAAVTVRQSVWNLDRVVLAATYSEGARDTAMALTPQAARAIGRQLIVAAAEVDAWIARRTPQELKQ